MESKIYTAEELRAESAELVDMLGEHNMTASMLRYAAEVCERADAVLAKAKKANETQMSFGCHSCVNNYIKEINYILCGDAKNENK